MMPRRSIHRPMMAWMVASATTLSLMAATEAAGQQVKLTKLELLGKHVFFDEDLSRPSGKQACSSCHSPARGWVLPNSYINSTSVVAPGAKRHRVGSIKTPSNAYASLSPPFQPAVNPPGVPASILPTWRGGNFWDGRAEGCGRSGSVPNPPCPIGNGAVSQTIMWSDLPLQYRNSDTGYVRFIGPTADQALNPFPNDVEQNIQERKVCSVVKHSRYVGLYREAYGEEINCKQKPESNPPYSFTFKRLAVALAAWQMSSDVNSFSSKRDNVFRGKARFSPEEAEGRTLFYGKARCSVCHNGVAEGQAPDPTGVAQTQLYTDHRYHNIGIPFNREILSVPPEEKKGLSAHVIDVANVGDGFFKTPTLRNVAKGSTDKFIKAFGHNGYFKSVKQIVHFYNTRDEMPACVNASATVEEALAAKCWPEPEFARTVSGAGTDGGPGDIIGNLGMSDQEEDAISAYLGSLTDEHTPRAP